MTVSLSPHALFILQTLQQAGYSAYIVGGAVRDVLLAAQDGEDLNTLTTIDYDFTTNARPEDIQRLFPESFYENNFGTVSITPQELHAQMGLEPDLLPQLLPVAPVVNRGRLIDLQQATKVHESLQIRFGDPDADRNLYPTYQITTFRSDEVYDDFRRPTSMNWGDSLDEDVDRRDFTINAMALELPLSIIDKKLERFRRRPQAGIEITDTEYTLIDKHAGLEDLQAHLIRTVGDPLTRFQEDALRMLRAIRFSVQLNMQIADPTFEAIMENAVLIRNISWERIRDEFLKMLGSRFPTEAIELLDQTNLLEYILPELEAAKGVEQAGHHTTDVWTHSLDALRYCPSPDPIVRLATLLHDIAKPQTQRFSNNSITFYNHELVGARMAKTIGERLHLPRKDINRLFILVRQHMFYYQPHNTDAAIRRFMRKVGLENIDDILDLREADRLGSGARQTSWRLEEMKQRMVEQLHQPLDVTDLAINGHDLMTQLNLKPGPLLGQILHALFEEVLDDPDLNNKAALLKRAQELAEQPPTKQPPAPPAQ